MASPGEMKIIPGNFEEKEEFLSCQITALYSSFSSSQEENNGLYNPRILETIKSWSSQTLMTDLKSSSSMWRSV